MTLRVSGVVDIAGVFSLRAVIGIPVWVRLIEYGQCLLCCTNGKQVRTTNCHVKDRPRETPFPSNAYCVFLSWVFY